MLVKEPAEADRSLKMELKDGADVFTANGEQVGKINRFVLDPATNEVTHIVVEKGWLLPADKVVPIAMIDSATKDRVVLNKAVLDLDQLPPFEETHFVELTQTDMTPPAGEPTSERAPVYYWYPPSGYIGYPRFGMEYYGWPPTAITRNIPADTIPLKEGAAVMSSDGEHVGDIERVFIDTQSHKATHFLVSQGLLLKEQKMIPTHWVKSVEEDKVNLSVPARLLERLPAHQA
jgi:uncharacterized protein YrrD